MTRHYHIELRGKVNQLGNKLHTMLLANKHIIKGAISERVNRIEIEAEGEEENLDAFVASCRDELSGNRIDEMIVEERTLAYYDEFTIL